MESALSKERKSRLIIVIKHGNELDFHSYSHSLILIPVTKQTLKVIIAFVEGFNWSFLYYKIRNNGEYNIINLGMILIINYRFTIFFNKKYRMINIYT